jgi:hypothetical protein
MDSKFDFGAEAADRIVYVRPVKIEDLPQELREKVGRVETLYAVHNTEGERLALVNNRRLAFVLARQHDLSPVTVH